MQDGDAEQRAWFHDRHVPYPPYALTEPGRLSAFLALGLPTGYITASDDLTIETSDTMSSLEYMTQAGEVGGLTEAVRTLGAQGNPALVASAIEFVAVLRARGREHGEHHHLVDARGAATRSRWRRSRSTR
jgi:hypothetical protein